jgi:hypothetical protein
MLSGAESILAFDFTSVLSERVVCLTSKTQDKALKANWSSQVNKHKPRMRFLLNLIQVSYLLCRLLFKNSKE